LNKKLQDPNPCPSTG